MKHLITLGVAITVLSSSIIGLPNLIAESRGSLGSFELAVGKENHGGTTQSHASSLIRFDSSLKGHITRSTNKGIQHRSNHHNPFPSGPSKLNHRKVMSALVTLSILARGN
jgi:hypothetical protein